MSMLVGNFPESLSQGILVGIILVGRLGEPGPRAWGQRQVRWIIITLIIMIIVIIIIIIIIIISLSLSLYTYIYIYIISSPRL